MERNTVKGGNPDGYAEDSTAKGQSLVQLPEDAVLDVALVEEKTQETEGNPGKYHEECGEITDEIFNLLLH